MKIIVIIALAVVAIVFIQGQGNPGLLDDFATWLGDSVENGVRWLGGQVEESDVISEVVPAEGN